MFKITRYLSRCAVMLFMTSLAIEHAPILALANGSAEQGLGDYQAHEQANLVLHGQMQRVANFLENYCTMNYSFPQSTDDVRWLTKQLMDLVPNNPFTDQEDQPSDVITFPNTSGPTYSLPYGVQNKIGLSIDNGLDDSIIEEWRTSPPDDWQAPPGTISAISNNRNLFVVWGAGADGRPIKNDLSGHTALVVGHWVGTWNQ
ncbi:MAG: hypothetical protein HY711_06615 [Candidatus Melainabacteria bacterium]|nr:hypothetical protein [Candidatus Melainabacteria bacterium]